MLIFAGPHLSVEVGRPLDRDRRAALDRHRLRAVDRHVSPCGFCVDLPRRLEREVLVALDRDHVLGVDLRPSGRTGARTSRRCWTRSSPGFALPFQSEPRTYGRRRRRARSRSATSSPTCGIISSPRSLAGGRARRCAPTSPRCRRRAPGTSRARGPSSSGSLLLVTIPTRPSCPSRAWPPASSGRRGCAASGRRW